MFGHLFGGGKSIQPPLLIPQLSEAIEASIVNMVGAMAIPAMPGAAQRAFQLSTDPNAEAHQFIEVIESDEALAARIGIDFEVVHTDIGKVVFELRDERSPCALCAKLRRGALNSYAVAHGCNKVALGHNREDVIETFFMSLLYEGRINTFAPVTYLSRRNVSVIRPLVFLPEKYALGVARARNLPVLPPNCDVAGHTKREEAKQLIAHLRTLSPDFEEKFMHALSTTETYGLWDRMRLKPEEPKRAEEPQD